MEAKKKSQMKHMANREKLLREGTVQRRDAPLN